MGVALGKSEVWVGRAVEWIDGEVRSAPCSGTDIGEGLIHL